jgi:putative membrane protein
MSGASRNAGRPHDIHSSLATVHAVFVPSNYRRFEMKPNYIAWAGALALLSTSAWAADAAPTDPQIAAIVVTANQVDIDAGKLAQSKSTSQEVKAFAQRMVTDHTGVNKSATELVQKLHVTPESNATSKSLQSGGDANLANLKKLSGRAFDKAYVDHEVAYHQSVLDAVDKTLIPSAKNAELKALLVKVRPAFVAHLEHAKHLQTSLGTSGA